jgi:hypothetical protein
MDPTSRGPRVVMHVTTAGLIPAEKPANDNAHPCCCKTCGALLGIERRGQLHLKYKDTENWFVGTFKWTTRCRRCGAMNSVTVGLQEQQAG